MIDEVSQLVQEAERDAAVPARNAQVDGVAVAEPIAAALARGRGRPHRHGLEVGVEDVQRVRGSEGARELRIERTAPRQLQQVGRRAQARRPIPRDGRRMPPGLSAASAHPVNLRAEPDAADNGRVRVVLLLLIPLLLFSAWQYTRREENENRLALVAGAVALRDVDVGCPGFWTRLVEITPNAGWVDFDEHGRPSDETSLSASTCESLERIWRGKQGSFRCLVTGGCDGRTLDAVQRPRHARPRVLAPARDRQRGAHAVLCRSDDRGGRAEPRRRSRRRARDCPAGVRGRLPRARRRVPLRAVPARRRVRPASRHSRLAQQLGASRAARTRTAEHRPGGASCAGRRRRTCPHPRPAVRAVCSERGEALRERSARTARRAARRRGGWPARPEPGRAPA